MIELYAAIRSSDRRAEKREKANTQLYRRVFNIYLSGR
jgi:hypothetical protein